ncbi:nucleoid-associated protein [Chromobacterium violaceum]|uniref:nucleoid-associated protein n=1 Tax=Chromobacterium violaceum TaxID=536 RepID=UPI000AC1E1E4|nr:nucleoid-associated protein [Chromobacterium violaceum]
MEIGTAKIGYVITHHTGNKTREEGVITSNHTIKISQDVSETILGTILKPILKSARPYEFFHLTDIQFNEAFNYSQTSFNNETSFIEQTSNLAKHLYSKSTNTSIPSGDLLFVQFYDVIIDDKPKKCLGIFKIEKKETFLSITNHGNEFDIQNSEVINTSGILKSAIVIEGKNEVYALEKGNEQTKYWIEDFLKLRPIATEKSITEFLAKLTKTVASKIEDQAKATEYKIKLNDLVKKESIRASDIYKINDQYVGEEQANSIKTELQSSTGFAPTENNEFATAHIKRKLKPVIGKYRINEGLEILAAGNVEIESIKRLHSEDKNTFIIQIKTKVD